MTKQDVIDTLTSWDVDLRTISAGDTESDLEIGTCDISGRRELVYQCKALTTNGEPIEFDAGEQLVAGHLGKIAGWF